jgi:hypothetical protein
MHGKSLHKVKFKNIGFVVWKRKTFKEPIFQHKFGDSYAKEEEGREERRKERGEKVNFQNF